jgi:hypothetical protein
MARTTAGLFFVKTLNGANPAKTNVPVVVGTYYEGQPLRVSATTGSAAKLPATGTAVYGVAAAYMSTLDSATEKLPMYAADNNNVFEGVMVATGAAQPRAQDPVNVRVGTTNNYRLAGTGTLAHFRVVGVNPDDASGTAANKRYWVTGYTTVWGDTAREPKG